MEEKLSEIGTIEQLSDEHLILLYRRWSEEMYSAGFMEPSPGDVLKFRRWMLTRSLDQEPYEAEMVEEYCSQIADATAAQE